MEITEEVKGILDYKNVDAIERYCEESNKSLAFGEEVFLQLMRWLYIGHLLRSEFNVPVPIYMEIIELDYMWHAFILFTKDYLAFCNRYFNNEFIHHTPGTSREPERMEGEEYESLLKIFKQVLKREFGEETVTVWFDDVKYGVLAGEKLRMMP